jgi:transposase
MTPNRHPANSTTLTDMTPPGGTASVQEDESMPAPLSLDLHRRFQLCLEEGPSGREAARRLRISAATGSRLAQKVRRGASLAHRKSCRPPGSDKLGPHREFLLELVARDRDITLFELRDALTEAEGVRVHHSAIARMLARLGFSCKKVIGRGRTAAHRCRPGPRRLDRKTGSR